MNLEIAEEEDFPEQASFCSNHGKHWFNFLTGNLTFLELSWCFPFKRTFSRRK